MKNTEITELRMNNIKFTGTTPTKCNIASLGTACQASNVGLSNGDTQVLSSSFNRTDGTTGASGVAEVSGSLPLASNSVYRDFTDDPQLTEAARSLPQRRGSGLVLGLREAMSLDSAQSVAL